MKGLSRVVAMIDEAEPFIEPPNTGYGDGEDGEIDQFTILIQARTIKNLKVRAEFKNIIVEADTIDNVDLLEGDH